MKDGPDRKRVLDLSRSTLFVSGDAERKGTFTVSGIPADVQSGDVVFYSPSGRRRGRMREWPWVLTTVGLIFLSGVLLFLWMAAHPAVRDVGLIGLGWVVVFIAGMVGGILIGRTWPESQRGRGL